MKTFAVFLLATFFAFTAASRAADSEQISVGIVSIQPTAPDSPVAGSLRMIDTPSGLKVTGEVRGVSAGPHGIHIHEVGSCEDGGNGAGGHYNPDGAPHGDAVKGGPAHPGDLGNVAVGPEGTGIIDAVLPGVTLTGGKHNVAGLAVILHEKEDDFGQPTGNAGGRIGCGPILLTKEQALS